MQHTNRLFGLDIARLLAMLMMVQGHTIFCLLNETIINSEKWYWYLWTFVRGFTAPIFLMVSGAVHIFANKRNENGKVPLKTLKKRVKVCLILLFIGYLLQFPANSIFDIPFLDIHLLREFLKVNVLQLFSVTLLFLNFLFLITRNNRTLAIICFIIGNILIIGSHFSLQINWHNILPLLFSQYLTMDYGSIFPITPFSGYLYIGVFIGYLLQKTPSENRNKYIIKNFTLLSIPYLLIGIILSYWYSNVGYKLFGICSLNIGISIYRVGVSLLVIVFGTLISSWLLIFQNEISMLSKRSLFIYVFHLLLIYGTPITPGLRHLFFNVDIITALYCTLFVIFFSILFVFLYEHTYKNPKSNYFYKYIIVGLLIYMLLI
jgi:uncharacterized membrane protein